MSTVYVQFFDNSEQEIISLAGGPQEPELWPFQGAVDTSDPRYKVYYEKQDPFIKAVLPKPD